MDTSLEERVTAVETELTELRELVTPHTDAKPKNAWLKSYGWAKADSMYDEAVKLGAEYRRTGRIAGDDAGA